MRPVLTFAAHNLPLLGFVAILVFYGLTENGVLEFARTEEMFGVFVVVLFPMAAVLALIQIALWLMRWRRRIEARGRAY